MGPKFLYWSSLHLSQLTFRLGTILPLLRPCEWIWEDVICGSFDLDSTCSLVSEEPLPLLPAPAFGSLSLVLSIGKIKKLINYSIVNGTCQRQLQFWGGPVTISLLAIQAVSSLRYHHVQQACWPQMFLKLESAIQHRTSTVNKRYMD